jgi:predicted neutral ceramidase superfamily lipid hydrolase
MGRYKTSFKDDLRLSQDLDKIERDIRRSWERYKMQRACMHGVEVKDTALKMVLLWMLEKGIISVDSDER